jgi:hypothetical protein
MINSEGIEGFTSDYKSCLKEYGLVCRREKSDQYHFMYKVPDGFDEGFLYESEINDLVLGKSYFTSEEVNEFLSKYNHTLFKFIGYPILFKVYNLIQHFGTEAIMGKSITTLTLSEALHILEKE